MLDRFRSCGCDHFRSWPRPLPPFTGLVEFLGPLVFRGSVNDRFLAALAALSLLAATQMVCAAAMASFLVATVTLSGWLTARAARLATVHGHADLRPPAQPAAT